tara:strand:+ start:21500 stop:22279 length:780 start_codon:yes stop_codon:yes gene_type:complete
LKIAIIQLNADSNKQNNIQNACNLVNKASNKNVDLILLPEVFNYRGPLIKRDLYQKIAEEIPGQSLVPLMEIALKKKVNILAGSIYERAKNSKIYNTSVMINDSGSIICKYRKKNLFKAMVAGKIIDENKIFTAGEKNSICEIKNIKIGLSICFDLRFPELYRFYYNQGVKILVIPSSFTTKTGRLHWEILLRARAIENHCYVLAPNQFGVDGNGVDTYGHSILIDPTGNVINKLNQYEEDILFAELSFANMTSTLSVN